MHAGTWPPCYVSYRDVCSYVGLQTLRLIKHLCNKGAHEFRRAMARHSTSVRCVRIYCSCGGAL